MNWSLLTFDARWMQALVVCVVVVALAVLAGLLWNALSGDPIAGDDFGHRASVYGALITGDDFGHGKVHV